MLHQVVYGMIQWTAQRVGCKMLCYLQHLAFQIKKTSSLFGISEGQSAIDMSYINRKKKPSLRLTKSLLLKSVIEASIIEPVQRHLPNVHGKNKFSHFSQDRVITSFGGGLDFKNYKPL